jgi:dolichol-phosphate mannosyltransferase
MALLLSVVIPTRNERENVGPLVERIHAALGNLPYEMVFVDDSDDETPQAILALAPSYPVRLIARIGKERIGGLAGAVVEGMKCAEGEYVCVLDADLQHPPDQIPGLLTKARESEADMVMASRYREGGSVKGLEGWRRNAISRACKWLARALLLGAARRLSDPLSGFFLVRRSLVASSSLRPVGYKIGLEVLVRLQPERVAEVPYEFAVRHSGRSKASLREGILFLVHLLRLLREVPQSGRVWKFGFVGLLGVVVNLGLLYLLGVSLGLYKGLAWFLAVEASVLHNFAWHEWFTWSDRRQAGGFALIRDAVAFHLAVAGAGLVNGLIFAALSLMGAPLLLAGGIGIAGGTVFNFITADRWVFRPIR